MRHSFQHSFPSRLPRRVSGLTLVNSKTNERLANDKGTIICLTGRTAELSITFGMDNFIIEQKYPLVRFPNSIATVHHEPCHTTRRCCPS